MEHRHQSVAQQEEQPLLQLLTAAVDSTRAADGIAEAYFSSASQLHPER